jgi:hypothetical protein
VGVFLFFPFCLVVSTFFLVRKVDEYLLVQVLLIYALSLPNMPNLNRRKRKSVIVDISRNGIGNEMNGRLNGSGLHDFSWCTKVGSYVR